MRNALPYAFGVALAIIAGCSTGNPDKSRGKVASGEGRDVRRYEFTYAVTVPKPSEGTETLRVWVPLPLEDPGVQSVDNLRITAPAGHRRTKDDVFGNEMLYVEVKNPTAPVKLSWTAEITRYADEGQGALPNNARYLASEKLIPIEGEAMAKAKALGVADAGTPIEKRARMIYDDVLDGMEYDKTVPGFGNGDFHRAMTVCKGNCTDFHARFIGIGRAAKIPVRFTMGIPMKPGTTSYNSYHCWAHWYDGQHWRPVDISEADKVAAKDPAKAAWFFGNLDADRISLSFGRDLSLVPAQSGEPLNYFVFPHAEADGEKVAMSKEEHWLFTWRDL